MKSKYKIGNVVVCQNTESSTLMLCGKINSVVTTQKSNGVSFSYIISALKGTQSFQTEEKDVIGLVSMVEPKKRQRRKKVSLNEMMDNLKSVETEEQAVNE